MVVANLSLELQTRIAQPHLTEFPRLNGVQELVLTR